MHYKGDSWYYNRYLSKLQCRLDAFTHLSVSELFAVSACGSTRLLICLMLLPSQIREHNIKADDETMTTATWRERCECSCRGRPQEQGGPRQR